MGSDLRFASISKKLASALRPLATSTLLAGAVVAGLPFAGTMLVATPSAYAADAAVLSAKDLQDVSRIEDYLNAITTLKADFVQISSDGGSAKGTVYMQRPGKMRFEYDPPSQILLVATGHDFIYYDKEINAPTYFNIDETPAGLILADHVSLSRDVKIIDFRRTAETIRVKLVRKSDPGAGNVTLVFQDNPLQLRQWVVEDATGIETTVTLFNAEEGMKLDQKLFEFKRIWIGSGN
ncbi:outer membrane lipoprotein carrier protein LolA [uncultured Thalassospira sp.]|jgi:outer membrane lipoprotein-sorting protein|uniref:LolA family protein n=1 Tax=uncultured Thalassospira sp. TaxID=404382 RepID=UPI0030DA9067|tara:strand:- start:228 stop:938 length:711 start_codon:yes stop_codon:yes gene_type:complete